MEGDCSAKCSRESPYGVYHIYWVDDMSWWVVTQYYAGWDMQTCCLNAGLLPDWSGWDICLDLLRKKLPPYLYFLIKSWNRWFLKPLHKNSCRIFIIDAWVKLDLSIESWMIGGSKKWWRFNDRQKLCPLWQSMWTDIIFFEINLGKIGGFRSKTSKSIFSKKPRWIIFVNVNF